jgi:hypothetical protein
VDQVIFVLQSGRNRHEHICQALELFAGEVMPRFAEDREEREQAKADRLRSAVDAALARRPPPREMPEPYVIDEEAELARARRRRRRQPEATPHELAALAAQCARTELRSGAAKLLARLIKDAPDAQIERRFGSALAQRVLFEGMARSFSPEAAGGFQGSLVYELTRPATGHEPVIWTIHVSDGRASARPGAPAEAAALTIRYELADFIKMAAGTLDPATPLLENRAAFDGDLGLAARLPEMFGAASPY